MLNYCFCKRKIIKYLLVIYLDLFTGVMNSTIEFDDDDDEEVQSCYINIPVARRFTHHKQELPKIVYKRNVVKFRKGFDYPSANSLKKYSLYDDEKIKVANRCKDEVILSLQQFTKQKNRITRKKKNAIKISQRHKIHSTALRKRMYLKEPPDDVHAMTDIDLDFFNYVNGRLLAQRGTCYKSLAHFLNYRLRKTTEIGYRRDTIVNIEQQHLRELEIYAEAVKRCMDQVKYFDQFVSIDYQRSMSFLEKCAGSGSVVDEKTIELEALAAEMFTITSRLTGLDYMYSLQQKYGRFLYYLSPPTWRAQHREFARSIEIEAKGFDLGGSNEDDSISVLFEKMRSESAGKLIKPVLYFKSPSDLMDLFETLEMQQQYNFIHVLRMAPIAKSLKKGITILKDAIAQDTSSVASSIQGFESLIQYYSERSKQLEEKFFKILFGLFYQSVGTAEVLKFALHLEFCYEKVLFEKPINTDIVAMAKTLESIFMDLTFRLESFLGADVKKAVQQYMWEEKIKNKKAKQAARELRLFERLKRDLLISFAPPPNKCEKRKVFSTINTEPSNTKPRKSKGNRKRLLTDAEKEYLYLFTDWNETEDPGLYLCNFETFQL